jgi:membrane dipeptidase
MSFVLTLLGLIMASSAQTLQVDLHLDTPTQILTQGLGMDAETGLEAGLAQLKAGGTNVAVMVLWPPRKTDHLKRTVALLEDMEQEIERLEAMELVRSPQAGRQVVADERTAIIFSLEGAHGLGEGDWRAELDLLHRRGLSALGLTWSFSNRFAGSSGDGGAGLSEEGIELVSEARKRGIILDVSHASRETTMAVCAGSTVPVIASHSDAYALRAHPRNLTDEEIRCIAESGGVIGLNFHAPFVGPGADVSRVADHADHLAKIGGRQVVALGSDFDGYIKKPIGLEDASKLGTLWQELQRRGWTHEEIQGLRGENFLRAWEGVLEGASD